jgi:hypothetical protein
MDGYNDALTIFPVEGLALEFSAVLVIVIMEYGISQI